MRWQKIKNLFTRFDILVLLLFVLVLVLLFVLPIVRDIKKTSNKIQAGRLALEQQYQNGQLLKKSWSEYVKIEQNLEEINSVLLVPGQELYLITTLEQIAEQHDLTQEITMDSLFLQNNEEEPKPITALPTQVELAGSFNGVVSYLAAVENLDFYVNWQQVSFRTQTGGRYGNTLPNIAPVPESDQPAEQSIRVNLMGETHWQLP